MRVGGTGQPTSDMSQRNELETHTLHDESPFQDRKRHFICFSPNRLIVSIQNKEFLVHHKLDPLSFSLWSDGLIRPSMNKIVCPKIEMNIKLRGGMVDLTSG